MTPEDRATLSEAYRQLENPSLAIRLSSAVGMPVEAVTRELGKLSLIHISEPTRLGMLSRMPSSA